MTVFKKFKKLSVLAVLGLALFAVPVQAQPTEPTTTTGADPVDTILNTIPEAQSAWQKCYARCHRNHECNAVACANDCKGQVINRAYNVSRIGEIMDFNVKAAYAATCIDQFRDYLNRIRTAALAAQDAGLSVATLIVKVIVDQILDAIIGQILNSLTNSICNVTNEALGALDSFIRNAICLPTLSLGNPLDFRLNLGRLQCNGWSINALTGDINGSPIDGISLPPNINGSNVPTGLGPNSPTLPSVITDAPDRLIPDGPVNYDPILVPQTPERTQTR